jgi:hypothetical protein
MIIDTTNDELLINGQRWQRGGYLLATAYATDQINITARDGRVIGKAIEWDRILDKDKNTFGLDRDGTVTALTNIFNSQVKSPYKIDALRDVENGTAAYGEIMIYRSPGEWQYEVLEQYHGAYDSEAATLRSGATATLELYYTAQADGDGISELSQSNTPASGYQIIRKLYYAERAQQDPDTGTWVQFADLAANTSFNDAKTALLAYLKERTGGTVPISLKMTWEEVELLLLEEYPGAVAAYSLRLLDNTYTGDAIRVRRASDNAEQDIAFDANGDLDTSALDTFCSGTDGFVKTWYDQSGNGNDAEQTTTANQPKIVSSGSIIQEGGKPALEFDGINDYFAKAFLLTNPVSHFVVAQASSTGDFIIDGYVATNRNSLYKSSADEIRLYNGGALYQTHIDGTQAVFSSISNGANSLLAVNGSGVTGTIGTNSMDGVTIGAIGSLGSGTYFDGTIQEVVLYGSDETSNRTGIETDINDFYNIYP